MNFRIVPVLALSLLPLTTLAATTVIKVFSFDFGANPPAHSDPVIENGDTVTWLWAGGIHSTTSAAGQAETWNSTIKSSGTFDHTFTNFGVFKYFCSLHGSDLGGGNVSGMSGKVIVAHGVVPNSMSLFRGKLVSGTVAQVGSSDNQYLNLAQGAVKYGEKFTVVADFSTTSPILAPTTLAVNVEDNVSSTGVRHQISLWNNETSSYEPVGSGVAPQADAVFQTLSTGTLSRFVDQTSGLVKVRVSYASSLTSLPQRYTAHIDRLAVLVL